MKNATKFLLGLVASLLLVAGLTSCNKGEEFLDSGTTVDSVGLDTGRVNKAPVEFTIDETLNDVGYTVTAQPSMGQFLASDPTANGNSGVIYAFVPGTATGGDGVYQASDLVLTLTGDAEDDLCGITMREFSMPILGVPAAVTMIGCEGYAENQGRVSMEPSGTFVSTVGSQDLGDVVNDFIVEAMALPANSYFGKCAVVQDATGDGHEDLMCTSTGEGDGYIWEGDGTSFSAVLDVATADRVVTSDNTTGWPMWSWGTTGTDGLLFAGNPSANGNKGHVDFWSLAVADGESPMAVYEGSSGMRVGISTARADETYLSDAFIGAYGASGVAVISYDGATIEEQDRIQSLDLDGDGSPDDDGMGYAMATCSVAGIDVLAVGALGMAGKSGQTLGGVYLYEISGGAIHDRDVTDDNPHTPIGWVVGDEDLTGAGRSVACFGDGNTLHLTFGSGTSTSPDGFNTHVVMLDTTTW